MSFEHWKQEKLLKKAKKQARKQLQKEGFGKTSASHMVKQALRRIAKNDEVKTDA